MSSLLNQPRSVILSGNDYKLSGTLIVPDDISQKIPAVVFYHGMPSQSKPRYIKRAVPLAKVGIAALCFDFRGCGESDGKLEECSIANWIEDALLAFDYLAKQSFVDANRVGIAGKSFGGYAAALVSEKRNVRSMVFHAPAFFKDDWFYKSFRWTPEFRKERGEYRNSKEALNNKSVEAMKKYSNPLLVIGSELDEMLPKVTVERFYTVSPSKNKKLTWIKGADHALTNEKYNEEYIQMMVGWFKETL